MFDTVTFGSFIHSFLASFRDDYAKLPSLFFPLLSSGDLGSIRVDDVSLVPRPIIFLV
jgi:hypothetical protein